MIPLELCAEAIGRHKKVALMWSGGKDSTAALFYLQPFWDKLTVYWLGTGDTPLETFPLVKKVQDMVPSFATVVTDVFAFIDKFGFPTKHVPERLTAFGELLYGPAPFYAVPRMQCCFHNIMQPTYERVIGDGCTLIIRGQKEADKLKNTVLNSGSILDGIEFLFPCDDETDESVLAYLEEVAPDFIHEAYKLGDKALTDCIHCTGRYGDGDNLIGKYKGTMEWKQSIWEKIDAALLE